MNRKIAVIGDEETVIGFRLAGVKKSFVFGRDEIKKDDFSDVSLIIVNEKIAQEVRDILGDDFYYVEIPDKMGPIERDVSLSSKLSRYAIGVEIKK